MKKRWKKMTMVMVSAGVVLAALEFVVPAQRGLQLIVLFGVAVILHRMGI